MVSIALITEFTSLAVAFIFALSLHEYAHARVALLFGDHTAETAGRVTLNPLKHLDPLGFLLIFLAGFGWAKPVPFNEHNFRRKILGTLCVALAGPSTNIILAIASLFAFKLLLIAGFASYVFMNFFTFFARINIMLGLFNLLPLPPLDGAHIYRLLGQEFYEKLMIQLQSISFLLLIVLINIPSLMEQWSRLLNGAFKMLYSCIVGA